MKSKKTKSKVLQTILTILKQNPNTPYLLPFWRQIINQKLPDHFKIGSTLELARKFKTIKNQGHNLSKTILNTPCRTTCYTYKEDAQ